jgi:hypothetical protein
MATSSAQSIPWILNLRVSGIGESSPFTANINLPPEAVAPTSRRDLIVGACGSMPLAPASTQPAPLAQEMSGKSDKGQKDGGDSHDDRGPARFPFQGAPPVS